IGIDARAAMWRRGFALTGMGNGRALERDRCRRADDARKPGARRLRARLRGPGSSNRPQNTASAQWLCTINLRMKPRRIVISITLATALPAADDQRHHRIQVLRKHT